MYALEEVKAVDPEVAEAIEAEMKRQNSHIELIASENWVSRAVMAAMGSPLTNKYAEGYSESVTTAAATVLTWWKIWPLNAPRGFLAASMRTYSLTPVHRPTWRWSLPC